MAEKQSKGVSLPPPDQVCIVVKDVDMAIQYYTSVFGLGPFEVMESSTKNMSYRGWTGTCRLKTAFAQWGPIELELIEVLEGETPHSEFIKEKGEGLHHLRFQVDDLEATLAELAKGGIEPVWKHNYVRAGVSFAYLNSDQIGGAMFELIEDRRRKGETTSG
ncbi:MAG: VOC family protein [Chloroflexi bacterium]|nr:VOC family protein [Chloroflexota bacterium]